MLYLVHHADAVPPEIDPMRPLSSRGRAAVALVALDAAKRGAQPDVIWHSGKLRARQTAEIVASQMDPRPPIVVIDSLSPDGSSQAVLADLEKQSRRSKIALVGHEPGIGELAARLAGSRHPLEASVGGYLRTGADGPAVTELHELLGRE